MKRFWQGFKASTHRRAKLWRDRIRNSRRMLPVLFWVSFAETLVLPIPLELVLIPLMLANRAKLWWIAGTVTLGCLSAAILGYYAGYLFFDTFGPQIIGYFEWQDALVRFRQLFDQYGFWAIVAVGILPIPFQIAILAAGAAAYSLPLFLLAATIARGARYYGLALLVRLVGDRAEQLWSKHKLPATLFVCGLILVLVFVVQGLQR